MMKIIIPILLLLTVQFVKGDEEDSLSWNDVSTLKSDTSVRALNAAANAAAKSRAERAMAIFTLFANHVKVGDYASDLSKVIADKAWLSQSQVQVVNLGGWVPLELPSGTTRTGSRF